jgi:hypothetical protein
VNLSFLYGANGDNRSATVSLGNLFTTTVNASQSVDAGVFNPFSTSFIAASDISNVQLVFTSLDSGQQGIILDNIVLSTGAIVPEPAMLPALLTLGVVGGALVLRRKQNAEQV